MFFGLFSFHKKAIKSLGDVFETRPAPKVLIQTCQCIQMILSTAFPKRIDMDQFIVKCEMIPKLLHTFETTDNYTLQKSILRTIEMLANTSCKSQNHYRIRE